MSTGSTVVRKSTLRHLRTLSFLLSHSFGKLLQLYLILYDSDLYRRASHDDLSQLNDLHIASYSEFGKLLQQDGLRMLNTNLQDNNGIIDVFASSGITENGGIAPILL